MWDDKSPVKLFDTPEEAQKEADKWTQDRWCSKDNDDVKQQALKQAQQA